MRALGNALHNLACMIGRHVGLEGERCAWCHRFLPIRHRFARSYFDQPGPERCRWVVRLNANSTSFDPSYCNRLESEHAPEYPR